MKKKILIMDGMPDSKIDKIRNAYERKETDIAKDMEQAKELLGKNQYVGIIVDPDSLGNREEIERIIQEIEKEKVATTFFLYTGDDAYSNKKLFQHRLKKNEWADELIKELKKYI
jgi:hypothetical protein